MSEENSTAREAEFYRTTLQQICQDTRRTRARRLAESALTFWDEMKKERERREPTPKTD